MARPKSGNALSPAEKQRRYRARQAARMEAAIEARVREMGVVIQGGPADMRARGTRGFVEDILVNAIVVGPEHRAVIETAVAEIAKSVAADRWSGSLS